MYRVVLSSSRRSVERRSVQEYHRQQIRQQIRQQSRPNEKSNPSLVIGPSPNTSPFSETQTHARTPHSTQQPTTQHQTPLGHQHRTQPTSQPASQSTTHKHGIIPTAPAPHRAAAPRSPKPNRRPVRLHVGTYGVHRRHTRRPLDEPRGASLPSPPRLASSRARSLVRFCYLLAPWRLVSLFGFCRDGGGRAGGFPERVRVAMDDGGVIMPPS
ncbi:hypothetical protein BC567DRAFT_851 [Phyllosticta citribraziliensis]